MSETASYPYPIFIFIGEDALAAINCYTVNAYRQRATEWGGLLWGRVFAHPVWGTVPVVAAATSGVCRATPVSCDILPESWAEGERDLAAQGISGLRVLGDYHSHPRMGVFLSPHADVPAFWAYGHIPEWLSMVVDPWRDDYGVFAKDGPASYHRVQTFLVSRPVLRALGLPEPRPQTRSNQPSVGENHVFSAVARRL